MHEFRVKDTLEDKLRSYAERVSILSLSKRNICNANVGGPYVDDFYVRKLPCIEKYIILAHY